MLRNENKGEGEGQQKCREIFLDENLQQDPRKSYVFLKPICHGARGMAKYPHMSRDIGI